MINEFLVRSDKVTSVDRDLPVCRVGEMDIATGAEGESAMGEIGGGEIPRRWTVNISDLTTFPTHDRSATGAFT
jgi:hypothetical protein